MEIKVIKTRKFLPPKDDLWGLIRESVSELEENSVFCITSKVVSVGEGRCIPLETKLTKDQIVFEEAEYYIKRGENPGHRLHTITNGILVGSAGIDESNSNGYFILWPKDPDKSAKNIWEFLRREFKLKNLGVVITDSNAVPLKRGIVGHAISYWGFSNIKNYVGTKDLFGREFKYTRSNIPDSLAAFAVYLMGEGREQTPIVIFEDLPNIHFVSRQTDSKKKYTSWKVPIGEDLFRPFLKSVKWKKGEKA